MNLPGRRMKLPEEEMNLPIPAKPLVRDFTDEEIDYLFQYHPPSPDQREVYEQINEVFRACGKSVAKLMPAGPGKTAAMRALSDTRMKCNQAVALKGRF